MTIWAEHAKNLGDKGAAEMSGLTKDFTSVTTTEWAIKLTDPDTGKESLKTHTLDNEGTRFANNNHPFRSAAEARGACQLFQKSYNPTVIHREVIRLEGPWEE